MIDFERLDAAITYAVEHPERFDFATWFERKTCGTTACLAGTVAWQAGWSPIFTDQNENPVPPDDPRVNVTAADVVRDGETKYVFYVARDLLGLDEDQADELFVNAGGIEGVIAARNMFAGDAGLPERTWAVAR